MLKRAVALLAAACLTACAGPRRAQETADLVLRGGRVYTMARPERVEALAVRQGKIVFAGADQDAKRWIGPRTRVVALRGRAVLPGFHDSHVHPITGGVELGECDLNALETAPQVLEKVRRCAQEAPSGWIRGGGWDLPLFPDSNPSKALLDAIAPERPVYLTAADGHSAWVNSQALAQAGITKATADPARGRIERDGSGEPCGVLREEAMELVSRLLPRHSMQELLDGGRRALKLAASLGITTLYEAAADEEILGAYAELERRGELTARVNVAFELQPSSGVRGAAALKELLPRYQGRLTRLIGGKIFADGVLEARTAAVLAPYADHGGRGISNWTPAELADTAAALDREGFQVHVHAIGDQAVRMALNAIAEARKRNGDGGPAHHLAHLELIDPPDLRRFKALNVVADFQPLWAYRDHYIIDLTEPGLGPQRSARLYPLGDALRAEAPLACGSDWSVSSMNPWEAIQVGMTRRGPSEGPGPAWLPSQTLSLDALLRCYTTGGAYANLQAGVTGSLEPGKAADMIVLERDPYETPVEQLHQMKVMATYLEGRQVHPAPGG